MQVSTAHWEGRVHAAQHVLIIGCQHETGEKEVASHWVLRNWRGGYGALSIHSSAAVSGCQSGGTEACTPKQIQSSYVVMTSQ